MSPSSRGAWVKVGRCTAALSLLVVGVLALSACGSSSTSGSGQQSAPLDCGGKKKLLASGSTAQTNAVEQFVYAYIRACPGFTLDYKANGSGSGVQQFVNNETDLGGSDKPLRRANPTGHNSGAAHPPGTCRRCSARSRSPTTSTA
jgi:phosphate transport system substrate-binding protein